MNKQLTAFLLFTWFLLLSAVVMFGQAKHEHNRKELQDIEYKLSDPPIPVYHMKCGVTIGQYEWNKLPEMASDSIGLVMLGKEKHNHDTCRVVQVLTSSPEQYQWSCGLRTLARPSAPDTIRVRMLVTYKGNTRNVAFTVDGYEVRSSSRDNGRSVLDLIYLDDRKRVIKNLEIWQVKIQGK